MRITRIKNDIIGRNDTRDSESEKKKEIVERRRGREENRK